LSADRPVVEVGVGATAVLAMSTLTTVVTFKTPASLKIVLGQMQKREQYNAIDLYFKSSVLTG
jgi:hypothetical protein